MSWEQPVLTAEFAAVGATALLEAVRSVDAGIRFYQAASSEIFGEPLEAPQTEETPLCPLTPYGAAKAYAHFIVALYRRRYGLHASSGILYNHESPRRPLDFLPRKVANGAARIIARASERALARRPRRAARLGLRRRLRARDVADAAAGRAGRLRDRDRRHTLRSRISCECAFEHVGLDWREHVRVDESLRRGKAELHNLVGDSAKARERLGWEPTVDFAGLVRMLVDADVAALSLSTDADAVMSERAMTPAPAVSSTAPVDSS